MDAVEYIKERDRMCKTYENCSLCPACLDNDCIVTRRSGFAPEQQVNTVKVWAEQHQRKTRQDVFLERYPNAKLDSEGILCLCPEYIYAGDVCAKMGNCKMFCYDCRHKFWPQEVEE